jgi:hypothetical protein
MSLNNTAITNDILTFLQSSRYLNEWGLIKIIKHCTNNNPYRNEPDNSDNRNMWKEQTVINFPILYLASVYLYIYAKQRGCTTFLFATRDCCHWYKVFRALFPDIKHKVHYFNCSRIMFERATENNNEHFNKYVKSLIGSDLNKVVFIDIHGTSKRVFSYFREKYASVPYSFLLSATHKDYNRFPKITRHYHKKRRFINIVFNARGSPCESLNYDLVGTLQDYNENGPVRDPLEYDYNLVKKYHDCMNYILERTPPLTSAINNMLKRDKFQEYLLSLLSTNINKVFEAILVNKPTVLKHMDHIGKHIKTEDKKNTSKQKSTDKGVKKSPEKTIEKPIEKTETIKLETIKPETIKPETVKPEIVKNINEEIMKEIVKLETITDVNKSDNNSNNFNNDKEITSYTNVNDNNKLNVILDGYMHKGVKPVEIIFIDILCNDTTYGLIWNAKYEGKTCVVKMIMLKSGLYYDKFTNENAEFYKRDERYPFAHTKFLNHKAMAEEQFTQEIKELEYLSKNKIGPKFFGSFSINRFGLHYGFIVMEKIDCSIKEVLVKRYLTDEEISLIGDTISLLHNIHNKVHGDLKPSNIGAFVDENGIIKKCVFLDCQKVRHKKNYTDDQFRRLKQRDWDTYNLHLQRNTELQASKYVNDFNNEGL